MLDYNTTQNYRNYVRNGRRKVCGEIIGDLLTKRAKFSKHFLFKHQGWSWDTKILKAAKRRNVITVEVLDIESGTLYRTTLSDFMKHGIKIDYGHGVQLVLPLQYWEVSKIS